MQFLEKLYTEPDAAVDLVVNRNWSSYGEELLAVADAVVSRVIDGIPDNTPLSQERAVPMNRDSHVGNCVVLDIGDHHYVLYAHLKVGSIPVNVGDRVKCGDIICRIGNSGNSDAPHLHFSEGYTSDPYSSEGVPYVFQTFDVIAEPNPSEDDFLTVGIPADELKKAGRSRRVMEMPVGDPLLYFIQGK